MKRSIHLQTWRGLLFAEVILLLLFAIFSIATAGEIKGVVRNLKGEPVEDAVVHILSMPGEKSQQSPKTEIMKQDKREFVPHILPVVVGTPVIFSNEEQMRHHIYSKYPVTPPFRHMFYTKGQTEQEVFDKEGIIELGCQIHKTMSAFVLVLQNPHFATTNEQGIYTIKNIPAGKYKLVVWHEFLPIKLIKTAKNIKVPTSGQVAVNFNYDLKMEHPKWKKPVPLKTEVGTGIADAKWNGSEANPQRFTSTDSYVVAVGTAERPEVVKAVKIEKALSADKEVRLFRVKIEGKFSFHSKEIRQDVYFTNTNFSGETDFYGVTFSGVTDFRGATFSGVADFGETTFSKGASFSDAEFSKMADFSDAKFSETVSFHGAAFSETVSFQLANFLGAADFRSADFLGVTDFVATEFSGIAAFAGTKFSAKGEFIGVNFSGTTDFSSAEFLGLADFSTAQFSGVTSFSQATLAEGASFIGSEFSKESSFSEAGFSKQAHFGGARFSGLADFSTAQFSGVTSFIKARFSQTDFSDTEFLGAADFDGAEFSGEASFIAATFSEKADFGRARFSQTDFGIAQFLGDADFSNTIFLGAADFSSATFSEKADFSEARFKDLSDFSNCLYPETARIDFSGVSNFSQMTIEWKYDSQGHTEDNQNKERRELNGPLVYDETFYLALIKNYQEMNWFSEADDCYYTYKKEKRKRQNFWRRQVELIFLDVPFGYGVKPWKLLRSFLVVWILFGIYYRRFLRLKEDRSSYPSSTRYNAYAFVWSFAHSLNLLTPGVDFHSLTDPYMKKEQNPYQFSEGSQAVIWAQRLQQILGLYLLALLLILLTRA